MAAIEDEIADLKVRQADMDASMKEILEAMAEARVMLRVAERDHEKTSKAVDQLKDRVSRMEGETETEMMQRRIEQMEEHNRDQTEKLGKLHGIMTQLSKALENETGTIINLNQTQDGGGNKR